MNPVCVCLCHLGIRPKKGEVKQFLKDGIDAADPIAVASACSQCEKRHTHVVDGLKLCGACGHEKWKHTTLDGCCGTYAEACRCLTFVQCVKAER